MCQINPLFPHPSDQVLALRDKLSKEAEPVTDRAALKHHPESEAVQNLMRRLSQELQSL